MGEDGSYPIAWAGDKEFIFFSDVDGDGQTERVRYFLGSAKSGNETKQCVTYQNGGSCSVSFSDFISGDLVSAEVAVSVEGDFGWSIEKAEVFADGISLGTICDSGCSDCAGAWQGVLVFDVSDAAADGSVDFTIDATRWVNGFCDWEEPNHAMKAKFELTWNENLSSGEDEFKKGIIDPSGDPVEYQSANEQVSILSHYVRNIPPVFRYYDKEGNRILDYPARLKDTRTMEIYLEVDVNQNEDPPPFQLESRAYLRNLSWNYE